MSGALISVFKGDITKLSVDVIVNAANRSLLGGGGVDGAIHRAAGPELLKECRSLGGCQTGECKMTDGYNLPSKRIAHTPGPVYTSYSPAEAERLLRNCYVNCLTEAEREGWGSIGFCSISTGVYPIEPATHVAFKAVRDFLESKPSPSIKKVVFCVFSEKDERVYDSIRPMYFP
ncbi:Hismacro and SEC14 domain-containing proteins [Phaffia rhodozyma]|uniref:Hismacro and SEC14 domain-containing proteins n=1 Tax=Phaffia rhodozyma TaxID=264483 RepID=A0A0F7SEV9_PHARH|nr:Hismacro and SEC14 domain-containing proteins [Phaffia rhodozyma]